LASLPSILAQSQSQSQSQAQAQAQAQALEQALERQHAVPGAAAVVRC